MKTPVQELINQVEEWMLEDKEVLENPSVWSDYLLFKSNTSIEVKLEFIEMCEAMLEKEKEMMKDVWIDGRNSHSNGQDIVKQIKNL
jgi:hypothetical protein